MESTTSRYPKSYKNSDVKRNRKTLDFDLFERWRLEKEKEEAGVTYFLQGWAFKVTAVCTTKARTPFLSERSICTRGPTLDLTPINY
jgi:hypothetical protein